VLDDIVGEDFGLTSDEVLLGISTLSLGVLLSIEDSANVLALVPDNHHHLEDDHDEAHDEALDIDPEDLAAVPRVEQVVATCGHHGQVHKGDLEQCVAIDALIVFHTVFEAGQIHRLAAHTRVLEAEQLEGRQHCEVQDALRRRRERLLVLVKNLVFAVEESVFEELIEDTVACIVGDKGHGDENRARIVLILE